jgi:hypothetical protein
VLLLALVIALAIVPARVVEAQEGQHILQEASDGSPWRISIDQAPLAEGWYRERGSSFGVEWNTLAPTGTVLIVESTGFVEAGRTTTATFNLFFAWEWQPFDSVALDISGTSAVFTAPEGSGWEISGDRATFVLNEPITIIGTRVQTSFAGIGATLGGTLTFAIITTDPDTASDHWYFDRLWDTASQDTASVVVNESMVSFPSGQGPVVVDEQLMVPVRGVFESLNLDVDWEAETNTAIISNERLTIRITIGSHTFTINGVSYSLEVPAQLINNRTMIPLESITSHLEGAYTFFHLPSRTLQVEAWNL